MKKSTKKIEFKPVKWYNDYYLIYVNGEKKGSIAPRSDAEGWSVNIGVKRSKFDTLEKAKNFAMNVLG